MGSLLTIGEFSRATHLSVKALRHYDDVGLLEPADVDSASGYRRYAVAQVPVAHVIRRFRDLDMPLDRIKAILMSSDASTRDRVVLEHLEAMQTKLDETQAAVAALQSLLADPRPDSPVEYRRLPAIRALAIRDRVDWDDAEGWLADALDDLKGQLHGGDVSIGPTAALYSEQFFESHVGEVVAFVPVSGPAAVSGRIELLDLLPTTCAVMVHRGPFATMDMTYGALGVYVTERGIGAPGPIREHYVVDLADDSADLITEVCWPIQER